MKKSYIYIIDWTSTQDAIKIGKADNIYSRYLQLKSSFGEADLSNSYWIEVPASKVTQTELLIHLRLKNYRKEIAAKSDGSTEFFDKKSIESLMELCRDMDLIIQKGIKEPKKKNKNIIDYTYQQQKKKEEFEKLIRKNQRTLKRFITVFKYLNTERNNFVIKYLKPSENSLIKYYNENSTPKRWVESIIVCPEKKLKRKFMEWIYKQRGLDMLYENKGGSCSMNIFSSYRLSYNDEYITSINFGEYYLNAFKSLRDIKKTNDPEQYDYNQKYLLLYLNEIISQIEIFLEKREADFDIENWLHPKYEWENNENSEEHFGTFKFLKPSKREIELKLEVNKIKSITETTNNWILKAKDTNSEILISRFPFKENGYLGKQLFFLSDEDNHYKFLKFLNELFINDINNINGTKTNIYYSKSISNKIYSLDDIFDEYD